MGADLPGPWERWEEPRAWGAGDSWRRGREARRGVPCVSQGKSCPALREVKARGCPAAPIDPMQLPKAGFVDIVAGASAMRCVGSTSRWVALDRGLRRVMPGGVSPRAHSPCRERGGLRWGGRAEGTATPCFSAVPLRAAV